MLLQEPPRSQGDLNLVLFGVPIRIHPMFWIVGLLLGMNNPSPAVLLAWMVALFFAILVHELGHAAAMRAFGFYPSIVLYGMGGLTSWGPGSFSSRNPGPGGRVLISAAGPAAGFALAAAIYALLRLAKYEVVVYTGFPLFFLPHLDEVVLSPVFSHFINILFFISVFWGLVNLLPVYPLDGGQIAREFLEQASPAHGLRFSLVLSAFTATLVAVFAAVQWHDWWVTIMFAFLAYGSIEALAAYGRRPW